MSASRPLMDRDRTEPRTRGGRPSLLGQRRSQIIDAFIVLVARHGLEGVTLDDVAAAAHMQRSAVRHYIGNRQALIDAAISELAGRYIEAIRAALDGVSGIDDLIRVVFSERWPAEMADSDLAFDALVQEAAREKRTAESVRSAYDAFLAETRRALKVSYPDASARRIAETAYTIVCLAEHNIFMQRLGYRASLAAGAARQAREIAGRLG